MNELAFLRERIPAYADYADEDARHLVDKQVRAYVGEALSRLRERLGPSLGPAAAERLENVLLMCEFTNQQFVRKLDHSLLSDDEVEHLHEVDHELIQEAERGDQVDAPSLDAFLNEIEDLFARRVKAIVSPAA
jgi:hypothetical protein